MGVTASDSSGYFALAGALGAAVLAIGGNQLGAWRQRKADAASLKSQLEAERQRLDDTLAAEARRQQDRIAHERELRDRDVLRERMLPLIERVIDGWVLLTEVREAMAHVDRGTRAGVDLLRVKREELGTFSFRLARDKVDAQAFHGARAPVCVALGDAATSLGEVHRALGSWPGSKGPISSEVAAAVRSADERYASAVAIFVDAAWKTTAPAASLDSEWAEAFHELRDSVNRLHGSHEV
jgi:hypothetical protein